MQGKKSIATKSYEVMYKKLLVHMKKENIPLPKSLVANRRKLRNE